MAFNLTRKELEPIQGFDVAQNDLQDLGDKLKSLVDGGFAYGELAWRRLPDGSTQFTLTAEPAFGTGEPVVVHEGKVFVVDNGSVSYHEPDSLNDQYHVD